MGREERFNRVTRILGVESMDRLGAARVALFGVGGVGSWAAEALVRSGIGHLTIVDADTVAESNINRQLMATVSTIGQSKVEVLKRRLADINPDADIVAVHKVYDADTAAGFNLGSYDYVVDAIDSLSNKALLILEATGCGTGFVSSMGAALKMDSLQVDVAEFWNVKGCPLAAALRSRFRRSGVFPKRKFKCVYSPERLTNRWDGDDTTGAMTFGKVAVNGALCHITAIFGMTLAGLVIGDIAKIR